MIKLRFRDKAAIGNIDGLDILKLVADAIQIYT